MVKRTVILAFAIIFLFAGASRAVEANDFNGYLDPGDLIYDAAVAIEFAQYKLSSNPEEKIMILNKSKERTLILIKQTEDRGKLAVLLEDFSERDNEFWKFWESLGEEDALLVAEVILNINKQIGAYLQSIIENSDLPESVMSGMEKTLEKAQGNQDNAREGLEIASAKAQIVREEAEAEAARARAAAAANQSESAPGQAGSTPGQSGAPPPGQSGSSPGASGTTPSDGSSPGNSGNAPGQSGSSPGASGTTPSDGSSPGNSGNAPGKN